MEEKEKIVSTEEKMSYETLEEVARRAINENKQLRKAVQELSDNRGIQRLEFLFKVVDNPMSFDNETISKAIKEIKEALFQPEIATTGYQEVVGEVKKDNE